MHSVNPKWQKKRKCESCLAWVIVSLTNNLYKTFRNKTKKSINGTKTPNINQITFTLSFHFMINFMIKGDAQTVVCIQIIDLKNGLQELNTAYSNGISLPVPVRRGNSYYNKSCLLYDGEIGYKHGLVFHVDVAGRQKPPSHTCSCLNEQPMTSKYLDKLWGLGLKGAWNSIRLHRLDNSMEEKTRNGYVK